MKKIKSILTSGLVALIVLASFGFGVIMVGFAIVIGGAFALVLRLGAGDLRAKVDGLTASQHGASAENDSPHAGTAPA